MPADRVIEIANLAISFNGRQLFSDLSLHVDRGENVLLQGESGSGKSTVLRAILGFVHPQRGSIHINGLKLNGRTVWDLRRKMAYVAQEPDLGEATVAEFLDSGFTFAANQSLRGNLHRRPALFDRFRLEEGLMTQTIDTLSGGQKQRLALVAAILLDRPIVLLDEASSALDESAKAAVVDFFREAQDVTVLAVSHDREWGGLADRRVKIGLEDTSC